MKENFININGTSVFYTEVNASKNKTIFFIHGNSGSHQSWQFQLASPEFDDYRLIAFDLPGHGKSAASKDPMNNYSVIGMAEILNGAVKQLAARREYHMVGLCSGSNIVAEMLADMQIVPTKIVLISTNVVGAGISLNNIFKPNPQLAILFKDECSIAEVTEFWQSQDISASKYLDCLVQDHLSVDPIFRSSLSQTVTQKMYSDEIKIIQKRNLPVLAIFGNNDVLVNVDYLDEAKLGWEIIKIADAGHLVHLMSPDKVNTLVANFFNA